MTEKELPSRAKPEALHRVCRYLRKHGSREKGTLYDEMEIDRRQIRAALEYGDKLGFLDFDGDSVSVTQNGHALGYSGSLDETSVEEMFGDAIDYYPPYREIFLWVSADEMVEEVRGEQCVNQSALEAAAKKATGGEQSRRELNLLIKTAQAAGLGDFVTGRKGLETRLKTSERFQEFMQRLIEDYGLPESDPEEMQEQDDNASSKGVANDTAGSVQDITDHTGDITITAEWSIDDMSEEEIGALVRRIREMGGETVVQ